MTFCPDDDIRQLLQLIDSDDVQGLAELDSAIDRFPDDARLYFLRGSLLAATDRKVEALQLMQHAVALDPEFHIARFQLGFFALSSGDAEAARDHWNRLESLPKNHYLRLFVTGLHHLIADEFTATIATLRQGISLNRDNPPLNHDMQLIIDKCADLMAMAEPQAAPAQAAGGETELSSTSLLINQLAKPKQP
ncbi:MAG: hypothetical protein AAFX04_10660 [Pseudomonadota bacterium]